MPLLDLDDLKFPCDRYGYVYLTTFRRPTDGKLFYYVGQHAKPKLDKSYIGSGKRLKYALDKHGRRGNLNTKILYWAYSKYELDCLEHLCIDIAKFGYGQDCLNLHSGGPAGVGHHSEATRAQMSLKRAGVPKPFITEALKGRPLSEIHKQRIAEAHRRPETRASKSRKLRGIKKPGVSAALKGFAQPRFTCPECGKAGGWSAMKMWHGEFGQNCRF